MIRSFSHKGLKSLFEKGSSKQIAATHVARILRMLDRLDASKSATDMNLPGFGFHELKGDRKGTYSVSVSGNWRLTYGFKDGDAIDVNLEDYH